MTLLNNTSYEVVPDKLIIDSRHPLDVKTVKINANQGIIKRGTVLSFVEPTAEYIVFGTTLAEGQTSSKANCIVADTIDTTSIGDTVVATVYISGNFNKNELIIADVSTLSSSAIEELRTSGIFVSSSIQ